MKVRAATAADAAGVAAVRAAVIAEGRWLGAEAPLDLPEAVRKFTELLEDPGKTAFVATDPEGAITGSIAVYPERPGVTTIGMFVDARHRGKGAGDGLLRAAIEWSRDSGAHKVALQVWPHNQAAIGLYRKLGFVPEGLLRRHARRRNGELWDVLVMGLLLDTTAPGSPHA